MITIKNSRALAYYLIVLGLALPVNAYPQKRGALRAAMAEHGATPGPVPPTAPAPQPAPAVQQPIPSFQVTQPSFPVAQQTFAPSPEVPHLKKAQPQATTVTEAATVPVKVVQKKISPLTQEINQEIKKADEKLAKIEFNFENADLQSIVDYIAELFDVSFLPEDAIKPMLQNTKGVAGNKISFKTERPMTKKDVWALYTTFLDIAGLALSGTPEAGTYRITASQAANRQPLPTYIGVSPDTLPDNDTPVRYVYFLANATIENIKPVVDQLRSASSNFTAFLPLRAIILTDKSYNIKALMKIVTELDKASLPEIMSIIKLKHTGAEDIKKLYDELTKGDDQRGMVARIFGAKRQPKSFFFPENTRVLAEPRTNTLILFGTQDTITKIEDFVKKVDTKLSADVPPIYTYELQFTDAVSMADILNKVTAFGIGTVAGQAGGVREGDKFFKPITFTPEKSGNRLIIKGDYEDYLKVKEVIESLDIMQPEVAIEVLIVNINKQNVRGIGSQIRNPGPVSIASNVNAQNSGFNNSGVIIQPSTGTTPGSIMANLIGLASSATQGAALLTLGAPNNIWAIFQALSTRVDTTVVSNPFLVTTNKYKASVSLGETRRIETSTVVAGNETLPGKDNLDANLNVVITPQINSDGIIMLDINIDINEFTDPVDPTNGNRSTRHIETKALLANKEVLAIGGIIRSQVTERVSKIPILGDIPLIGWLAKNKNKEVVEQNLLVFISPQIIEPKLGGGLNSYTQRKAEYSRGTLRSLEDKPLRRDPIHRWFFTDKESPTAEIDDFLEKKEQAQYEDVRLEPFYKSKVEQIAKQQRTQNRGLVTTEQEGAPDTAASDNVPSTEAPTEKTSQKKSSRSSKKSLMNFVGDEEQVQHA
jgi:general secretion pathway protein D